MTNNNIYDAYKFIKCNGMSSINIIFFCYFCKDFIFISVSRLIDNNVIFSCIFGLVLSSPLSCIFKMILISI